MSRPILVLQMQRMGDLILTFPLLLWLRRRYPDSPLLVVAEQMFFEGLMPVSPQVTYVSRECVEQVAGQKYELVINLSHRPEAAELAGRLRAEAVLGPRSTAAGQYIHGHFQLYRAALTHCNRHNRFHWAELNALDIIPLADMAQTLWPQPQDVGTVGSVGLFLGASEEAKRPSVAFWGRLCRALLARGLNPVLLGGPAEVSLGEAVARSAGREVLNLCGRLSLRELAAVGHSLGLVITPDTGPMHLAAWMGTRVLNLSMGPVNPWETGPYQPGHWVLRPSASCAGCWSCPSPQPPCREHFSPARVAAVVDALRGRAELPRLPGLQLLTTGRSSLGLYELAAMGHGEKAGGRELLSNLWQAFFGHIHGLWDETPLIQAGGRLARGRPELYAAFVRALLVLPGLLQQWKGAACNWPQAEFQPMLRPLCSYLQLYLQNADGSRDARRCAIRSIELLLHLAGECYDVQSDQQTHISIAGLQP